MEETDSSLIATITENMIISEQQQLQVTFYSPVKMFIEQEINGFNKFPSPGHKYIWNLTVFLKNVQIYPKAVI